ncbi:hypothetical protein J3A83DRAFT_4187853 [Scleroderma citrinum]
MNTPNTEAGDMLPHIILEGRQEVRKFNQPDAVEVEILMALFRIRSHDADVVVSASIPNNAARSIGIKEDFYVLVSSFLIKNTIINLLDGLSPIPEATKWLTAFRTNIHGRATGLITSMFHELGFWKDILALTWNFRTIRGSSAINRLLDARLALTGLTALSLTEDSFQAPTLLKPMSGVVFLRLCFEFETNCGRGTAVAFLVPTPKFQWKAWSIPTCLESLKDYPEKVEPLRSSTMDHEWEGRRLREMNMADSDPTVLIIGAGHVGLQIAARLKYMSVSTLVIERHTRIGDNWRTRYNTLCLYGVVYSPRLGPCIVLAPSGFGIECLVIYQNRERMTVRHLIFATGFGGGYPKMPNIEGKDTYYGTVLHSSQYIFPASFTGKKVVVVGAGNSAHDIAMDLYCSDADVMILCGLNTRVYLADYNGHFPLSFADILGSAMPWPSLVALLRNSTLHIASIIDKTNLGMNGAGTLSLIYARGDGFYIDTGACREIINGNIKIKSGSSTRRFVSHGLELEDGTEQGCGVVIFATGCGELRDSIREICGPDIASKVGPIWGLDDEGEQQGMWRRTGQPHLWIGMEIKAFEEGLTTGDDIYV